MWKELVSKSVCQRKWFLQSWVLIAHKYFCFSSFSCFRLHRQLKLLLFQFSYIFQFISIMYFTIPMTFRYIHFINVLFARYLILCCSKYSLNTNIHYKIWTTGNESEMLRANFNCGVWIRCNTFSAKCSVSDFQIYMFHKYFIVNSGEWIIYILKMQHIVQSAQSVCKSFEQGKELAAKRAEMSDRLRSQLPHTRK